MPSGEFAGKISETLKDQFQIKWNDEDKSYHSYLEKNLGKKVLNGGENYAVSKKTDVTVFILSKTECYATHNQIGVLSDYLKGVSDSVGNVANTIRANSLGQMYITIDNSNPISTSEDTFKTWLSNNNLTVYYRLKEPRTIDLGKVEMLLSYFNVTNVYTDILLKLLMYAKYYREFVATIRNLQVNNGTLQSELADVQSRLTALETSMNNLLVSLVDVESEVTE